MNGKSNYIIRIWLDWDKDHFLFANPIDKEVYDYHNWQLVVNRKDAAALPMSWIAANLSKIHDMYHPERLEIIKVKEYAQDYCF